MIKKSLINVSYLINLIRQGDYKFMWSGFKKRIWSKDIGYGLKRDLDLEFKQPPTLIKTKIRLFKESDREHFEEDRTNKGLFEKKISSFYVATTQDDKPCYCVWLIDSSQNEKIVDYWGGFFPPLNKDEVLVENSYTVPKFRGMGIMPYAMSQVSEKGKELGARYAIHYTSTTHVNSLRAGYYAGFKPYILRTEKWFMFKRTYSFGPIPDDLLKHYEKVTQPKRRVKKSTK